MPEVCNPFTRRRMVMHRRVIEATPIELDRFSIDAAMITVAGVVERQVNELLRSALDDKILPTEFKINWMNQPDMATNPFGDRGRFRTELRGYKPE